MPWGSCGGGVPCQVQPGGVPCQVQPGGVPWPGGYPGRGGTLAGGYPGRGDTLAGGYPGWGGYPGRGRGDPGRTTEGVLTTRRAVCLLPSRRRTFLFNVSFTLNNLFYFYRSVVSGTTKQFNHSKCVNLSQASEIYPKAKRAIVAEVCHRCDILLNSKNKYSTLHFSG